ncbi:MAG: RidA family protein [Acidobacteria bacterium]|nr:RidA family protein [Acidobacteriota bacterium]
MNFYSSDKAPKAIGPYSQAVSVGNTYYLSGQTPIDPATGKLVEGGFEASTRQVFRNLGAVLTEAGLSYSNVVKVSVFLIDFADFAAMNAIYAEYFGDHKPARSTVQVAKLPLGAPIEIDFIAVKE